MNLVKLAALNQVISVDLSSIADLSTSFKQTVNVAVERAVLVRVAGFTRM